MSVPGKYIALEGIAEIDKAMLMQKLAAQLQANGVPVQVIAASKGPPNLTTHEVQQLINNPHYHVRTEAEALLYSAAGSQVGAVMQATVSTGTTCLVGQSALHSLVTAYYGEGTVQDYDTATEIITAAVGKIVPDLTIVLDTPVNTLTVPAGANSAVDQNEAYLERMRAGYLWEAKQRGYPVIYATEPLDVVFQQIWEQVAALLRISSAKPTDLQSIAEVLAAKPAQLPRQPQKTSPAALAEEATPYNAASTTHMNDGATAQPLKLPAVSQLLGMWLDKYTAAPSSVHYSRSASFDHKNAAGQYRYYTPPELTGKLRSQYLTSMNQLFETYGQAVQSLEKHLQMQSPNQIQPLTPRAQAIRVSQALLPIASTTTATIRLQKPTARQLIANLQTAVLPEAQQAAQYITSATSIKDAEQSKALAPRHRQSTTSLQALADELLPPNYATDLAAVTLTKYTPRNELDCVADMLYGHSDLPLQQLRQAVESWPYQRKVDAFNAYIGERLSSADLPGDALQNMHYQWDIVCDYATYRDLQQRHLPIHSTWQPLTPRYGYTTPKLIDDASMADMFDMCFDTSLQLYSSLQAAGLVLQAQYATLFGHKLRWQLSCNAQDAFRILETHSFAVQPDTNALLVQMHEKLSEIHPLLAETMRFVGRPSL